MKRLSLSPTAMVALICTLAICLTGLLAVTPAKAAVNPENLFEFDGEYYYFDDYGNMYLYDEDAAESAEPVGTAVNDGYYGNIASGEDSLGADASLSGFPGVAVGDMQDWANNNASVATNAASTGLLIVAIILGIYCLLCMLGALLLLSAWKTNRMGRAIAGSIIFTLVAIFGINLIALAVAVLGWVGVGKIEARRSAKSGDCL